MANNDESTRSTDDTGIDISDLKDLSLDSIENNDDEKHEQKLAAIITMSTRVDQHIDRIMDLQSQVIDLQMKQMRLLDGCLNFIHELQDFHAKNSHEAELLLETFIEIKAKVQTIFEKFAPKKNEGDLNIT